MSIDGDGRHPRAVAPTCRPCRHYLPEIQIFLGVGMALVSFPISPLQLFHVALPQLLSRGFSHQLRPSDACLLREPVGISKQCLVDDDFDRGRDPSLLLSHTTLALLPAIAYHELRNSSRFLIVAGDKDADRLSNRRSWSPVGKRCCWQRKILTRGPVGEGVLSPGPPPPPRPPPNPSRSQFGWRGRSSAPPQSRSGVTIHQRTDTSY